jgi:hypothetical protein
MNIKNNFLINIDGTITNISAKARIVMRTAVNNPLSDSVTERISMRTVNLV